MLNFDKLEPLIIEDFELRKLEKTDVNEIFITRTDERVLKYLDIPKAENHEDSLDFINTINHGIKDNKWLYWGIVKKGQQKIIGTLCLWNLTDTPRKADIGFVLLPDFHCQGIMQQLLPAIFQFAFKVMLLDKVEAEVSPKNLKSIRLLEKFGFKFEEKVAETYIYALNK